MVAADVATQAEIDLKAPLASPTFTGTVTVPTPFTIGAISMTSTATELNLLDGITVLSGSNTGDEAAASLTVSGIVEMATQAEADAGTDTLRTISPDTLDGFALSTDLGGTLGAPTVVDDSHNHVQANIDALTHTEGFVVFDGVMAAGEEMLVHTNAALTLVSLDCTSNGGSTPTTTYTVVECASTGATCVSSGLAASLSALNTLVTDDSPTDAAVDANDWWGLEATTLTTEPNIAHCTVEYTIP